MSWGYVGAGVRYFVHPYCLLTDKLKGTDSCRLMRRSELAEIIPLRSWSVKLQWATGDSWETPASDFLDNFTIQKITRVNLSIRIRGAD
ncbi:MAG: hypothetical protein C5B55_08650 [Blastocatellia bacterium]|nr:MAG: hypothetical protein C5B55_08650 [Blastocatellia bacterium]